MLDHIARWEPQLCALYAFDPDAARAAAKAATARWAKGEPAGALDGVPVTIKENIATKGVPTPIGCAASDMTPAAADAPPAARLRESGAVILGKTTMPDYGMLSSGLSSFHKLARNPWNLSMNPGGSSAGAGAAGAGGYGPIHIGTDIGGSIRLPAGWCGLVGLKPSFGPRADRPALYRPRRRSADTYCGRHCARYEGLCPAPTGATVPACRPPRLDWTPRPAEVRGLRVGLMLEIGAGLDVLPETRSAVEAAARLFEARRRDHRAGQTDTHPRHARRARPVLARPRLGRCRSRCPAERRARHSSLYPAWAESGAKISSTQALRGFGQTFAIRKAAAALFQTVDVVISPTSPVPTFPAELASPIHDPEKPFEHIGFTVTWNMSEQPAATINCGYTSDGLPIGLQIVGPRFDDAGVLRLAQAYETWRGPQRPWPGS